MQQGHRYKSAETYLILYLFTRTKLIWINDLLILQYNYMYKFNIVFTLYSWPSTLFIMFNITWRSSKCLDQYGSMIVVSYNPPQNTVSMYFHQVFYLLSLQLIILLSSFSVIVSVTHDSSASLLTNWISWYILNVCSRIWANIC